MTEHMVVKLQITPERRREREGEPERERERRQEKGEERR